MENAPVRHLLPVLRRNPDPLKDEIVKRELPQMRHCTHMNTTIYNINNHKYC